MAGWDLTVTHEAEAVFKHYDLTGAGAAARGRRRAARARTAAEFGDLLARAGFEVLRVIPTGSPAGLAIIESRPSM